MQTEFTVKNLQETVTSVCSNPPESSGVLETFCIAVGCKRGLSWMGRARVSAARLKHGRREWRT